MDGFGALRRASDVDLSAGKLVFHADCGSHMAAKNSKMQGSGGKVNCFLRVAWSTAAAASVLLTR